jgi:hypothetical protein
MRGAATGERIPGKLALRALVGRSSTISNVVRLPGELEIR